MGTNMCKLIDHIDRNGDRTVQSGELEAYDSEEVYPSARGPQCTAAETHALLRQDYGIDISTFSTAKIPSTLVVDYLEAMGAFQVFATTAEKYGATAGTTRLLKGIAPLRSAAAALNQHVNVDTFANQIIQKKVSSVYQAKLEGYVGDSLMGLSSQRTSELKELHRLGAVLGKSVETVTSEVSDPVLQRKIGADLCREALERAERIASKGERHTMRDHLKAYTRLATEIGIPIDQKRVAQIRELCEKTEAILGNPDRRLAFVQAGLSELQRVLQNPQGFSYSNVVIGHYVGVRGAVSVNDRQTRLFELEYNLELGPETFIFDGIRVHLEADQSPAEAELLDALKTLIAHITKP